MTENNEIYRALPISRARRELTSILRRSQTAWLTRRGVPVAELAPVGDRLLEDARASTLRAADLFSEDAGLGHRSHGFRHRWRSAPPKTQ